MTDIKWAYLTDKKKHVISSTGIVAETPKKAAGKITMENLILVRQFLVKGYPSFNLLNKSHSQKVYREVAEKFIPISKRNGNTVNHIDGNKLNSNVENLEWITASENSKHAHRTGLINNAKKVRCIETGEIFPSIVAAAKSVNKSSTNLSACLNGRSKTCDDKRWEFVIKESKETKEPLKTVKLSAAEIKASNASLEALITVPVSAEDKLLDEKIDGMIAKMAQDKLLAKEAAKNMAKKEAQEKFRKEVNEVIDELINRIPNTAAYNDTKLLRNILKDIVNFIVAASFKFLKNGITMFYEIPTYFKEIDEEYGYDKEFQEAILSNSESITFVKKFDFYYIKINGPIQELISKYCKRTDFVKS